MPTYHEEYSKREDEYAMGPVSTGSPTEETVDIKNNYNTGDKCRNRARISSIGNPQGADYRNTGEHLSGHAVFAKRVPDRRNSTRNVEARSCIGNSGNDKWFLALVSSWIQCGRW